MPHKPLVTKNPKPNPKPKQTKTYKRRTMTSEQLQSFMDKRSKCIQRFRNKITKTLETIKRKTKKNPPKIVVQIE
jgi:hypothetical protein